MILRAVVHNHKKKKKKVIFNPFLKQTDLLHFLNNLLIHLIFSEYFVKQLCGVGGVMNINKLQRLVNISSKNNREATDATK